MDTKQRHLLSAKQQKSLIQAIRPQIRSFNKGDLIFDHETNENRLCLLLKGTAYLCIENESAVMQLLDFFMKGQFFCYEMIPFPHNCHCFLQAKYPCSIAYLEKGSIRRFVNEAPDTETSLLLQNIFPSMITAQSEHCHMLQQKTIRGKLLAFLHYQQSLQSSRIIHVPIPYSDLADYLTIDRSAMMTELTKMQREGLLEKSLHDIRIV